MALLYVLPNTAAGFQSITTANDASNPLESTTVSPSSDYRLFKVRIEGNVDMSYKVQYANTSSGPWMAYNENVTEDFDSNGGAVEIYVMLQNLKYHRVIIWDTDDGDGQVKITIDTDPIVGYVTIGEVRDYLKTQDIEYNDSSISQLIVRATSEIDERTGRTWQGTKTVTDEYITPGDDREVQLENVDIQSITAFSVDVSGDGTYTSVTTSTLRWNEEGSIQLTSSSEVCKFPEDVIKGVKVSYTYGNSNPTYAIKQLCLNLITYYLDGNDSLSRYIQLEVNKHISNKYLML